MVRPAGLSEETTALKALTSKTFPCAFAMSKKSSASKRQGCVVADFSDLLIRGGEKVVGHYR
jgi:hypothetical protein